MTSNERGTWPAWRAVIFNSFYIHTNVRVYLDPVDFLVLLGLSSRHDTSTWFDCTITATKPPCGEMPIFCAAKLVQAANHTHVV